MSNYPDVVRRPDGVLEVEGADGLAEGDVVYVPHGIVKRITKTLPFEVGKTYETNEGYKCRILCVDRKGYGSYPIMGLVWIPRTSVEHLRTFTLEGYYTKSHPQCSENLIPKTVTTMEIVPFTSEDK